MPNKSCWYLIVFISFLAFPPTVLWADSISSNPIIFVTAVPNPQDFGTLAATFGNHVPNPDTAFRGGDLWIRYPDGTLKNLTQSAGYGTTGFQGASSIAVRDPAVNWEGNKIIFSMVVGAATAQYQVGTYHWQLYEVTGIGAGETPVITKLPNQPAYNNHSPIYASDNSIIFVSDRPRDNSVLHTYPQRDEYESSRVNTGLWKLNPQTAELVLLDHAPSGNFNPIIDSFGRVIFTRWDHLQRDQQNVGVNFGAFNYESETSNVKTNSAPEVFPEPRSVNDPDYVSTTNLHTLNQFFPWMMNQDGTDLETLNHVGRQEIGLYSERNFNDDPNVEEFYGQYTTGINQNEFTIFLHIKEDPLTPGTYLGTNCQEFGTHSSGQIISIKGPPGLNPNSMVVNYLTHPDTSGSSDSPSANHSGLYRDPLPLSNGKLLVSHTTNTRQDSNIGSATNPLSRYAFRLKLASKSGTYFIPSTMLTSGITKSVSFWSPDQMISYNGQLWEMMPVELKSRTIPTAPTQKIPNIEANVISSLGISEAELLNYLRSNNLALVVSRNLTTRDKNDRQQPTNLRVAGTSTQSLPKSGKIYDISKVEFFQGDLIRGYSNGSSSGRRVLAQHMHSVAEGINPILSGAKPGSVQIAEDGSMAAFVPARRALSWQMVSPTGAPVVRERYWVTFQPGEVRVCASCHGVNTSDHLGNGEPTNPPQALAQLLAHWKNLPPPVPNYALGLSKGPFIPKRYFTITAYGGSSDTLTLKTSINGKMCSRTATFSGSGTSKSLKGRLPRSEDATIRFYLYANGTTPDKARKKIILKNPYNETFLPITQASACKYLMTSFTTP
jgi:Hydrazine synthase alpha subunit middle domain